MNKNTTGFTIVELLIVIVVTAILAAISIVAYSGVQQRARNAIRQSDIKQVQRLVELYYAQEGHYPVTTTNLGTASGTTVRTDENCHVGTRSAEWVPGITSSLPQSVPNTGKGVTVSGFNPTDTETNRRGCYMYASDGQHYILSAWNNIESGPQTSVMYRRLGFPEINLIGTVGRYLCNHAGIGGYKSSVYNATADFYKYSYTVSNITDCNETPPPGA